MCEYKLHYFNIMARGEVTRYLLTLADQPFHDIRHSFQDWPSIKPSTPFGQLPYLEVDGEVVCQSQAIERLLAKRFGRYGDTDLEQARSDMVVGCCEDMVQDYQRAIEGLEKESDKRKELTRIWIREKLSVFIANLEKLATSTGFIAGKHLMWPDLFFSNKVDCMQSFILGGDKLNLDQAPQLKAILQIVESDPKIAAWMEKRPKTHI